MKPATTTTDRDMAFARCEYCGLDAETIVPEALSCEIDPTIAICCEPLFDADPAVPWPPIRDS